MPSCHQIVAQEFTTVLFLLLFLLLFQHIISKFDSCLLSVPQLLWRVLYSCVVVHLKHQGRPSSCVGQRIAAHRRLVDLKRHQTTTSRFRSALHVNMTVRTKVTRRVRLLNTTLPIVLSVKRTETYEHVSSQGWRASPLFCPRRRARDRG